MRVGSLSTAALAIALAAAASTAQPSTTGKPPPESCGDFTLDTCIVETDQVVETVKDIDAESCQVTRPDPDHPVKSFSHRRIAPRSTMPPAASSSTTGGNNFAT